MSTFLVKLVIDSLHDGTITLLTSPSRSSLPSVERLAAVHPPAAGIRAWGMYIKLAVPLRAGLPLLIYIGSGTGELGISGRFWSHVKDMIACNT